MNIDFLHQILFYCDIAGTIAFAVAGTLVALETDMDISGAMTLAFFTSNGGGTIRDLLLGSPVFWMADSTFIVLPLLASMLVFFFYFFSSPPNHSPLFNKVLTSADTTGLIAFTIGGTAKAIAFHQMWIVVIMMGALTAVGGGVMRDVLARRIPVVFQGELYITPAIVGSAIYLLLESTSQETAVLSAALAIIYLRFMSIYFGWHLPSIKHNK